MAVLNGRREKREDAIARGKKSLSSGKVARNVRRTVSYLLSAAILNDVVTVERDNEIIARSHLGRFNLSSSFPRFSSISR